MDQLGSYRRGRAVVPSGGFSCSLPLLLRLIAGLGEAKALIALVLCNKITIPVELKVSAFKEKKKSP